MMCTCHQSTTQRVVITLALASPECYFFYDAEGVDLYSCLKLSGALIDSRNEDPDTCILKFISHDVELFSLLCGSYWVSLHSIREKYNSSGLVEPRGSLLEKCVQMCQRFIEVTTEYCLVLERVVAILNGDTLLELVKHKKGRKDKLEDDTIGILLLDKTTGGALYQKTSERLQNAQVNLYKRIKLLIDKETHFSEKLEGDSSFLPHGILRELQSHCKNIERMVMLFKHWLDDNFPLPPPVELNEDHRLTVILSHPHGCCKKITIGELTERTTSNELCSQLTYSTPTCPGSYGAMVFVLGQLDSFPGHPHSAGTSSGSLEQLNESGISF